MYLKKFISNILFITKEKKSALKLMGEEFEVYMLARAWTEIKRFAR